jgi:hypothetical protein
VLTWITTFCLSGVSPTPTLVGGIIIITGILTSDIEVWAKHLVRYNCDMAFSHRAIANNRFEIMDTTRKQLLALAIGRKSAEIIVEALEARFGAGEQQQLFDNAA